MHGVAGVESDVSRVEDLLDRVRHEPHVRAQTTASVVDAFWCVNKLQGLRGGVVRSEDQWRASGGQSVIGPSTRPLQVVVFGLGGGVKVARSAMMSSLSMNTSFV